MRGGEKESNGVWEERERTQACTKLESIESNIEPWTTAYQLKCCANRLLVVFLLCERDFSFQSRTMLPHKSKGGRVRSRRRREDFLGVREAVVDLSIVHDSWLGISTWNLNSNGAEGALNAPSMRSHTAQLSWGFFNPLWYIEWTFPNQALGRFTVNRDSGWLEEMVNW